jgi:6-phosphogluconolactonase (cycloisomerase 2 family)
LLRLEYLTLFSVDSPAIMRFSGGLLVQAAAALAVKLYVADSGGNVTTLALTQSGNAYNLSVAYRTTSCQPNPSWLILDGENEVLYCYDRGATTSINGSMNSFSVAKDGNLTAIQRVNAPFSGVYAELFGQGHKRGIATAS